MSYYNMKEWRSDKYESAFYRTETKWTNNKNKLKIARPIWVSQKLGSGNFGN